MFPEYFLYLEDDRNRATRVSHFDAMLRVCPNYLFLSLYDFTFLFSCGTVDNYAEAKGLNKLVEIEIDRFCFWPLENGNEVQQATIWFPRTLRSYGVILRPTLEKFVRISSARNSPSTMLEIPRSTSSTRPLGLISSTTDRNLELCFTQVEQNQGWEIYHCNLIFYPFRNRMYLEPRARAEWSLWFQPCWGSRNDANVDPMWMKKRSWVRHALLILLILVPAPILFIY